MSSTNRRQSEKRSLAGTSGSGEGTPTAPADLTIQQRLAQVRREFAGERGRSRFARALGLTASTWGNYEKDRSPPAHLLVKVADLTGADLTWLLTGRRSGPAGPSESGQPSPAAKAVVAADPRHRAILQRAADLLAERPGSLAALAAFMDLLGQKSLLEQSLGLAAGTGESSAARTARLAGRAGGAIVSAAGGLPHIAAASRSANAAAAGLSRPRSARPAHAAAARFGRWVPIFGRASAGLARFWTELNQSPPVELADPLALDRMIARAADLSDVDWQLAVIEPVGSPGPGTAEPGRSARSRRSGRPKRSARSQPAPVPGDLSVRLVQLSEPITDYQLTEFLEAPALADRYRPLFGWRLDGDSMAPLLADGTIVLCCPGEPARPGAPAVVRLAGQIGLTCKIYRPRGEMIRLVPANDKYPPQEFPARQLDWALAVLGSVRLG